MALPLRFEYNVIEGFRRKRPEAELKDVVDYSRERRAKLILWSRRAQVQEPRKLVEVEHLAFAAIDSLSVDPRPGGGFVAMLGS